jgi:hypothetical protein
MPHVILTVRIDVKTPCGYSADMARNEHEFRVRVPDDVREAVVAAADKNGRSINAEIVAMIRGALGLEVYDHTTLDDLYEQVEQLRRDVGRLLEHTGLVDPNGWKD